MHVHTYWRIEVAWSGEWTRNRRMKLLKVVTVQIKLCYTRLRWKFTILAHKSSLHLFNYYRCHAAGYKVLVDTHVINHSNILRITKHRIQIIIKTYMKAFGLGVMYILRTWVINVLQYLCKMIYVLQYFLPVTTGNMSLQKT